MKTKITSLMLVAAALLLTTKLIAQNPIPSYNVPVVADPTTFEESPDTTTNYGYTWDASSPRHFIKGNMGEKTLNVVVKDMNPNSTAWAEIEIHSINGNQSYGSYSVSEGLPFNIMLDESIYWGIVVLDACTETTMDVWFE